MEYLVSLLEGVITFVSPCLLPLLPLYIAYFAGGQDLASDARDGARFRHTLMNAIGFVCGFTLLFVALGALSGTFGSALREHQALLNLVCGLIVIVFGLNYLGIFKIGFLNRTLRPDSTRTPKGFFSSILFGIVFAAGWTPCVGAFLGAALSLAASSASVLQGTLMLVCYSAGLGIPFIITAVLIERLEGAFSWIKAHYDAINAICGWLLVAIGVLMATGLMGSWLSLIGF